METTDLETGVDPLDALIDALDTTPTDEATANSDEEQTEQQASAEDEPKTEAVSATTVELDGKKLEIPQGTPPALVASIQSMAADLKADYTRKTQEVAEIRKLSEARADAIQKQEELLTANIDKVAELKALQRDIGRYEQIDWQALADTDPAQATKLNLAYQQLQREAGTKYREIQQAEQTRQQLSVASTEKARELARLELSKRIPTITEADKRGMLDAAKTLGATESHLYDPVFLHALHKAAQWDRLQADKPKAMQKVAAAPTVLKPGPAEQRKPNQAALDRFRKDRSLDSLAAIL